MNAPTASDQEVGLHQRGALGVLEQLIREVEFLTRGFWNYGGAPSATHLVARGTHRSGGALRAPRPVGRVAGRAARLARYF